MPPAPWVSLWTNGKPAMANYVHGKAIKTLESADGQRKVDIVARNDRLFQFYEYVVLSNEYGTGWVMRVMSGLFQTADDAESSAKATFNLR
jgi:hypothetical protein